MTRTAYVQGMQDLPSGEGTAELLIAFTAIAMIGLLILLVAWMNVSSLMVAAAVGRRHEIAVRLSLGASRTRLIRQLVTESTVLALMGGSIGLVLAWLELSYMAKTEIDAVEILPDLSTFAFTLGIALATGILFGLSPALHATRDGVATALRDSKAGSAGRSRLQRNFVAVQIMLSQPLLVLIGVMLSLLIADYRPLSPQMSRHVIDIRFRPLERASVPLAQRREAVEALLPRIAERPEVLVAVPASEGFAVRGVIAPERRAGLTSDTAKTIVNIEGAAPGWFSLVDVAIVLGRDVSLADTAAAEYPVVIGSDLARALWGDAHPVGRTLASPPLPGLGQDSIRLTVIGVYDAGKRLPGMSWNGQATRGNMNKTVTRIFTARGKQWRHDELFVRTRGPAEPFLTDLQRFIRTAAPALPVSSIQTLSQQDDNAYHDTVRTALLAGAGGLVALLLASLGLYGVVALAVQQRMREIGIRIAVGAAPTQVARMFLASGVRVSLAALLFGLPLSIVALRLGLSQGIILAPDVNVWAIGAAIAFTLLAVASAATWVPARRASRVDPSTTLRVD
jgi:predicted permease